MVETRDEGRGASEREIVVRRTFDAPRALVFEAWTRAEHLARWWGPTGFSVTTHAFEFRTGGGWIFTMHGPDGADYPNRIVYDEISRPERLRYRNFGEGHEPHFETLVTFVAAGERTEVVMRGIFPSEEARDFAVYEFRAIEGGEQTLARLAGQVDALAQRPRLEVSRTFRASRSLVFEAWSAAEHLSKWFPPDGFSMPLDRCGIDFREGGPFCFVFRGPDGTDHPFEGSFCEVVKDERIVFEGVTGGFTVMTTLTFEGTGDECVLRGTQVYSPAAPEGARAGWAQTLEHLATYLASR